MPVGMENSLDAMLAAVNYREWLLEVTRPHLGDSVLEVGAGIGTMTAGVLDRSRVVALEFDPGFVQQLRQRFAGNPRVEIHHADAAHLEGLLGLTGGVVDSAMSFNVFEHIDRDDLAFRNVAEVIKPGGRFVCFVPAFPVLYGGVDHDLGHCRRYRKAELAARARDAGLEVDSLRYFNLPGFFAWGLNTRILRARRISGGAAAVRAYDRCVVPVARRLETRWAPPFGQSLLLVARRPADRPLA
ncbi:MAG: class I SAM-dependent methyltransferase [Candidatus Dormibacteraeota bacterium]|nr:class I SAM-dependent methyltransferase [Candidatus Dormibacteraeota bacterium]